MDNEFLDFIMNAGLYDKHPVTKDNFSKFLELLAGNIKIESFCPKCGSERVFEKLLCAFS